MAESLQLYYFPRSFYSQKAVMALKQRQLSYEETFVEMSPSGTYAPWYIKLNPNGQVPVLKIGDKYVPESDAIIDAIDNLSSAKGSRLVPDVSSDQGKLVSDWRAKIDAIPAEIITFGVMRNKELQTPDTKMPPGFNKEAMDERMKTIVSTLKELKAANPELSESYDKKIAACERRMSDDHLAVSKVQAVFDKMDATLDDVEVQLKQMQAENPSTYWLCGSQFSAADINLCVLIGRINFIGYRKKYLDAQKRPTLVEYWKRAMEQEAVGDTIKSAMAAGPGGKK